MANAPAEGTATGAAAVTTAGNTFAPTPFYDASGASFLQRLGGVLKFSDDGITYAQIGTGAGGGGFVPAPGANLADANATVQPFADKASQYALPVATLTTGRTVTLGITSVVTGTLVRIVRKDLTANTLAVANGGANGGTLFTFAASPTGITGMTAMWNGADWVFVGFEYLA